jgi:hypothetical protein
MINNLDILFSCGLVVYVLLRAVMLDRREHDERKSRIRPGAAE